MAYKINTAVVGFGIGHFIAVADGSAITTGTPTCGRIIDGVHGACANAAVYTTSAWEIDLAAGDMNGTNIILTFSLAGAISISYTIKTETKLVSELKDETMVGTDSAALASVLGAAIGVSISADIVAVKSETALIVEDTNAIQGKLPTNKFMGSSDGADDDGTLNTIATDAARLTAARAGALTDWINGGRLDQLLDAVKVVTDDLAASATTIVSGTVAATAGSTTVIYSDDITEATADHYNGRIIIFTSGAMQNQATNITDYELFGGEGKFTVTATTETAAEDVTFVIV